MLDGIILLMIDLHSKTLRQKQKIRQIHMTQNDDFEKMLPSQVMLRVQNMSESPQHEVDINEYMYFGELAKHHIRNAIDANNRPLVLEWLKVGDYVYHILLNKNANSYENHLLDRINLRLWVIESIGQIREHEITSLTVIMAWIQKELSQYDFQSVQDDIKTIDQLFKSTDRQKLLKLRHLRYWVNILYRIKGLDPRAIPSNLNHWLTVKGQLP